MREHFPDAHPVIDIDLLRSCLIFVGSSPSQGHIFFLKFDIKWAFFIYSNTSESYVINLRGHTTSKLKFVQEMSKIVIAIYLCCIHFRYLV